MIEAKGLLAHHFWGEYLCDIGLEFKNKEDAVDANSVLGADWKVSDKCLNVLVWRGNSNQLSIVKEQLKGYDLKIVPCGRKSCSHQCKNAEIDNLAHSIDKGADFTISIPRPVCKEQLKLF